jgi:4-hydroxythreonine-4-phosphate dehydrogenase
MASERPVVIITMGDASGIGPEIVVKALASEQIYSICRPVVIGERATMEAATGYADRALKINPVEALDGITSRYGTIDLLDLHNLKRSDISTGKVCAACGRAAMENIKEAARFIQAGKARALVTAPINKEATRLAGYGDTGHLEYLARLTGAGEYATMLMTGNLRVVHLTTHYSLRQACDHVTKHKILARLKLTHESFLGWGIDRPRIAVAALNPHGGEGGLFGTEEIDEIIPAVKEARDSGIEVLGPFPADSVFNRAIKGEFDVVLAMYHDQGHIAVKVHGFEESVSVALGLPFVRTSVDHGTAFDIAGKGIADARSMEAAIRVAVNLAEGKGLAYHMSL